MHWKENTALTTSGEVEMKEKIMEESNITTATSAMSQTSSITSTSSVISVVADVHQADDSESIVPSSSQCLADPLPLCPSLSDGGGVSYDAEDTVDPHCVVDLEENVSDSGSLRQNVLTAPVTSTDDVVIGSSSASSPPSLSQSVSSTQSGTEVGHSVSDSLSNSSAAVEEASVVPLGVALTNSFNSISAAAVGPLVNSVDPLNASDSAVETDDSFQEEMVIDDKDIKQEADSEVEDSRQDVDSECEDIKQETDSEGEDTVDGHVLNRLQDINLKAEADSSSNSSCSLKVSIWESDASMRQRLFNTLSQSFPGSALSRILHSVDTMATDSEDEEFAPTDDRLCSSCFGSISLDKEDNGDLTSLEWLQKDDLLKDMSPDLGTISEEQKENAERQKSGDSEGGSFVPQPHPSNVPYNPQKHVNAKPPFSFSCLIFMAVEESPGKKLPVKDIYNWILTNFPYYQNAPVGWKNSVRHNLSLNKCFKKVEKDKGANIGKGSLWCIDPEHRPNLLQALRKTPYHPYQQLQMMSSMVPQQVQHVQGLASLRTMPLTQRPVPNSVPPHLFPFLSRRLAQTNRDRDVANILLSMGSKNTSARSAHSCENGLLDSSGMSSDASDASGPTYLGSKMKRKAGPPKRQGPHIITPYPNPEHSYSSLKILEEDTISGESSIDNEYDFGGEDDVSELSNYPSDWDETSGDEVDGDLPQPPPSKRARLDTEDMTVQRGAQLLMNLYHLQPGASSDTKEDEEMSPEKSSPPCSKSLPRSTKFQRSSSASPLSRKRSSTAATKSSSLSSSLSSSTSSSSSVKKTKPKPVSRSTLKTKLFPKKSANSAAASKKSLSNVSSKTAGPSKSVGASGSKTAAQASTSSSSSKKSELSKTPEASKKLDSAATPPSAKPASTPVSSAKPSSASSSTPKASIIMTRRGKAAAELAAAAKAAAELGTTSDASASATEMDTSASGTKPNAASASQTKSETSVSGTKSGASASQSKSGVVTAVHRMRTRGKKLSFS